MKKFYMTAAIILSLFIADSNYSAESNMVGNYLNKHVVEKKLKNGITVIVLNRGYSPTVALNISFRSGSVDESYATSGAAHILEHMLFKGTETFGTRDYVSEKKILNKIEAVGETIDRLKLEDPSNSRLPEFEEELQKLEKEQAAFSDNTTYDMLYSVNGGIGFNAWTSKDMTSYVVQLPSDSIELWAKVESERIKKPVLREYYKERNNIYEERLTAESSPENVLYETLFATAFIAHPYRHPVLGWKSNIRYMSIRDVRRFYRDYYIPSRMTITVIGKIDPEKTVELVEKYFGDIESRPDPSEIKIFEPEQKGERRADIFMKAKPMLVMAWKKPNAPSPDDYTFAIITSVLGWGDSSRLYKSLVIDKKIATSVYAWNGSPGERYENLFGIYAAPADGVSLERLEQEIYSQLKDFRDNVTVEEINRAVNMTEASFVFMLDDNSKIAGQIGYSQSVYRDWRYLATYMDILNKIDVMKIKDAYDRYIRDDKKTIIMLRDSRSVK